MSCLSVNEIRKGRCDIADLIAIDVANRFAKDNGTDPCRLDIASCDKCAYQAACKIGEMRLCAKLAADKAIEHFFSITRIKMEEGGES